MVLQADRTKAQPLVLDIMGWLDSGSENAKERFDAGDLTADLRSTALADPLFAIDSLTVLRSCILLQFCTNIALIFANQAEEAEEGLP